MHRQDPRLLEVRGHTGTGGGLIGSNGFVGSEQPLANHCGSCK